MIYDGEKFFNLKDRYGMPYEVALDRIYAEGHTIGWKAFIDRAKQLKYKESRIKRMIDECLLESFINKDDKLAIENEVKEYL